MNKLQPDQEVARSQVRYEMRKLNIVIDSLSNSPQVNKAKVEVARELALLLELTLLQAHD